MHTTLPIVLQHAASVYMLVSESFWGEEKCYWG